MSMSDDKLLDALTKITDLASTAVKSASSYPDGRKRKQHAEGNGAQIGCYIMPLPGRLLMQAASTATKVNPINAAVFGPTAASVGGPTPMMAAIMVTKYWGAQSRRLTVSFMETTPSDLRSRIVSHMNAWDISISFVETQRDGDVRISRGAGGYWSYLGTDILLIPKNAQTMNLQGFTMSTSESEFRRVVRHETGHTLGMPHEHMRKDIVDLLDRERTYAYFLRTQGWDRATVDQQVLTPLEERSLFATPVDQTSIMCYQLPGEITRSGDAIPGGIDINATDRAFATERYPKVGAAGAHVGLAAAAMAATAPHAMAATFAHDWDPSEDVVHPV